MVQAVAYARYSSDNQRDESIDAQVRAIKYYAQQYDYNIVHIYIDKAVSASKKTENRKQFLQMMKDSAKGQFTAVLVHKLNRFSRNVEDNAHYEKMLNRNGVELVSVSERLDSTPQGRFMKNIIVAMNDFYSRDLANEVMKGMKENAYNCKHNGGIPPLGYDFDKDMHYVINPTEAAAVQMIFEMYKNGVGYGKIINALNARGYLTKRGQPFGKNSLYEILKNEKYTGVYTFNVAKGVNPLTGKYNKHKQNSADEIIRIDGGIPQIISNELFNEVKKLREKNKKTAGKATAKATYLLSGRVFCGECKHALGGEQRKYGGYTYHYYTCNHAKRTKECSFKPIHRDDLENAVFDAVNKMIFSPEVIDSVIEKAYASLAEFNKNDEVTELEKSVKDVERKMKNIMATIAEMPDVPELKEHLKELSAQKAQLTEQLYELTIVPTENITLADLREAYRASDIRNLEPENLQALIKAFVKKVYVYQNNDVGDGDKVKVRIFVTDKSEIELDRIFEGVVGCAPPQPIECLNTHFRVLRRFYFSDFCLH